MHRKWVYRSPRWELRCFEQIAVGCERTVGGPNKFNTKARSHEGGKRAVGETQSPGSLSTLGVLMRSARV